MKQYKIITLILMLLTSGNMLAEELDTLKVVDVEEILVIAAPKENRKLREQPTAVTLLSQQDMQAAQVNSIKNLTGLVPNMFIPDYGSRLTSAVYIRGIGSRINTPSIGLYVDNIPYIDKSAFDFDYSDIERIDVLRGPQGTLYGRNAMGGLIKIHTKSPFSYQGTDFRMGAGTHNAYNTSLTHYHRVSKRFAFSTGGFYDYEGGFFRNAALNNKKIDKGQSAGGRFRGIYLPSDNWKADLNVSYEYSDQGGYPYYYTGSVNPAAQSEEMKPYVGTISNNRESDYYRNLMNAGLNLEYQAQHFTLSAVTGYQFLKDRMSIDQDFTAKDIYTLEQKQRIHTLSEELVMKSKGNGRWQWATGVFGFYQWLKTDAPVTFRKDGMDMLDQMLGSVIPSKIEVTMMPGMGLNILPSLQLGGNDLLINGDFDTPLLNGALFHQSTFRDLFGLRGLSFTAGLRLDYEKMKMNYNSGTAMDYTVGIKGEMVRGGQIIKEIPMMPETSLTVQSRYQGSIDKDYLQLLPKFALQYDFKDNLGNVYATVSKGYRSGGYNIQMFSDLLQSSLKNDMMRQTKEEVLKAIENSPGASYKDLISEKFPDAGKNPDARSATEYKPEQTWNYEVGTHLNLFNNRLAYRRRILLAGDTRPTDLTLRRSKRLRTRNGKCRQKPQSGRRACPGRSNYHRFYGEHQLWLHVCHFQGLRHQCPRKRATSGSELQRPLRALRPQTHADRRRTVHLPHQCGILAGPHPTECQLYRCGTHLLDRRKYRQPVFLRHSERPRQLSKGTRADRPLGAQCFGQGLCRFLL